MIGGHLSLYLHGKTLPMLPQDVIKAALSCLKINE